MLRNLLNIIPRPVAIIRHDYTVSLHNRHFAELCTAEACRSTIFDALNHAPGLARLFVATDTRYTGLEIALCDHQGNDCVYWCEAYTLRLGGKILRGLVMADMTQQRAFEAAHLEMIIRKVSDDNLWIVGDDLTLLYVRADIAALHDHMGLPAVELVAPADRPAWERCMLAAKNAPEQTIDCSVRAASDGLPRMITIQYLPGGTYGGRYYAATRRDEPHGIRVVLRIKEAYQVRTDAELAERMGIRSSAISRVNISGTVPPAWVINTWHVTGVSAHWLLTGQGQKMG